MAAPWHIFGWIDYATYMDRITKANWDIRYSGPDFAVVRIPPTEHNEESWQLIERKQVITNDWWLKTARSKKVIRDLLTERHGKKWSIWVIDGIVPVDTVNL